MRKRKDRHKVARKSRIILGNVCLCVLLSGGFFALHNPKGPNLEKNQDLEIFKRA